MKSRLASPIDWTKEGPKAAGLVRIASGLASGCRLAAEMGEHWPVMVANLSLNVDVVVVSAAGGASRQNWLPLFAAPPSGRLVRLVSSRLVGQQQKQAPPQLEHNRPFKHSRSIEYGLGAAEPAYKQADRVGRGAN